MLTLLDNETGLLHASSDARVDPQQSDAMDGLSLDVPLPLTYAIRTGMPQFIPNHEEFIRDWPQAAGIPYLGSFGAMSITPLSPVGDQPLAWLITQHLLPVHVDRIFAAREAGSGEQGLQNDTVALLNVRCLLSQDIQQPAVAPWFGATAGCVGKAVTTAPARSGSR
ncbi:MULTISPECIES: hypothetical protein [unclassified Streptomyces]|uniref:hypothetical protein n=1 Tax=unclassified Streptomyces TaxID=2593676 RepID=UPI002DDB6E89|nr:MULTISPECIES: hypothetical protein [unclassified Streptomyces]WSC41706.1 hypothetical protein OHA08_43415 [Streptomyces sp. NBC_01763]WSD29672.1 hypothetical protein OHA26_43465 [Streptomyces sp. NBC_01751]